MPNLSYEREVDQINSRQLSAMIDSYQNLVFSICLKITKDYFTSEDLTQETFLSAYRNYNSFDGQNEKAWICRIAVNKCLDYQKRKSSFPVSCEELSLENHQTKEGLPESEYIEKEDLEQLKHNCLSLKPPYDKIAYAYYVKEKRAEEIALSTGKNIKTIQTQIYRARAMLRKIYGKERGT